MKVSVIIPIYNVEPYIKDCLLSVVNQTWKDGEIECILVDDCGTDNSMQVVEEFLSSYSGDVNFKTIVHEHNKGLSVARNNGIDACTGDYILFMDSDDYLTPDSLKILVGAAETHKGVELVHGKTVSIPEEEYYVKRNLNVHDYIEGNDEIKNHFTEFSINVWDKLISAEYLKKNNIRYREGIIHEDELFSFYMYGKLNSIAFVNSPTYSHIIRGGSIMTTLTKERSMENWSKIITEVAPQVIDPYKFEIDFYYFRRFLNYYDKSEVWMDAANSFIKNFEKNHRFIDKLIFQEYVKTVDDYYRKYMINNHNDSNIQKAYHLLRHKIASLKKN